jgi:hypothetical protein
MKFSRRHDPSKPSSLNELVHGSSVAIGCLRSRMYLTYWEVRVSPEKSLPDAELLFAGVHNRGVHDCTELPGFAHELSRHRGVTHSTSCDVQSIPTMVDHNLGAWME